jgi:hypothetical protein
MNSRLRGLAGPALVVLMAGCGGSSSPTPVGTPPATTPPTTQPATASPSPAPSASPSVGAAACRYGKGSAIASCARHTARFTADVDRAIDDLVRQRPDIFDTREDIGGGQYRVVKADEYYAGVIANLQARDFCAGFDLAELQVKNGNEFSEQYDILASTGFIRKGGGAYRSTCQPANFPLDPEDQIADIRVAFFGISCPTGVPRPGNGEGRLPVGCTGNVTATPKKADGTDVPAAVHGDTIDWFLEQEHAGVVRMADFPGVSFNKTLTALEKGHFRLCATVKGRTGCLNGEVP